MLPTVDQAILLGKEKLQLGERVYIWCRVSGEYIYISINKMMITRPLLATVIAEDVHDGSTPYLLGWKEGEEEPTSRSVLNEMSGSIHPHNIKDCRFVSDLNLYISCRWITEDCYITRTTTSYVSGGMQCAGKYCGTFNPWAAPNTPEGKYLCYSCRTSGHRAV